MPYTANWGSNRPGCLIFLVDQSASMSSTLEKGSVAPGQRLDHMVSTILNKCITDVGKLCTKNGKVSPRLDIAVIGYNGDGVGSVLGGALAGKDLVSITQLMENPMRVDERTTETMDDAGILIQKAVKFPVFLDPKAVGGTPMNAAVEYAGQIAHKWVESHKDSHPPVVINVSDGWSTDGDPRDMAGYLKQLATDDGNLLMFNCHISTEAGNEIKYPAPGEPIPQTEYDGAQVLYDMSSEIPELMRDNAKALANLDIQPNARGYLFNGDVSDVAKMFTWATIPGGGAPNPNE